MTLHLRELRDDDLEALFAWERDAEAVRMAAFTRADPSDRGAFDAHYATIRSDPSVLLRAVVVDGALVGSIGTFEQDGEREVTYWIDPRRWGEGIASRAVLAMLRLDPRRPMRGRVAAHNVASAKVLERAGFALVGTERGFAAGVGREIEEGVYRLEASPRSRRPGRPGGPGREGRG